MLSQEQIIGIISIFMVLIPIFIGTNLGLMSNSYSAHKVVTFLFWVSLASYVIYPNEYTACSIPCLMLIEYGLISGRLSHATELLAKTYGWTSYKDTPFAKDLNKFLTGDTEGQG